MLYTQILYLSKVHYTAKGRKKFVLDNTAETNWYLMVNHLPNILQSYTIEIPKGFIWDGATIFQIFTTILGYYRTGIMTAPSVFHDYIYMNHGRTPNNPPISRYHCDSLFYAHMIHVGVTQRAAKIMYKFCRWFGWILWFDNQYYQQIKTILSCKKQ